MTDEFKQLSVKVTKNQARNLKSKADEERVSVSAVIRWAIKKFFENDTTNK